MNKLLVFFIFLFTICSCKYFVGGHCNNTMPIIGTYENIYDKEAQNILVIKEDGAFEQTYTKKGKTKTNKGTWKFFKGHCAIDLKGLKLMHEVDAITRGEFVTDGIYRVNTIRFNEDLRDEFDFYRVN